MFDIVVLLSLLLLQVAFWGNPITSASQQMDYFVSGDLLEHPYRSRMPVTDEPYLEQVVLLEGQGVWYNRPEDVSLTLSRANFNTDRLSPNHVFSRADFQLEEDWFVFFCPQSVFKIHPLFDQVLARILRGHPRGHLVVTGGRRQMWTDIYTSRLVRALGGVDSAFLSQLHVIPRVSSERFLALMKIADVVLHPFPFDGSRTSADALVAGIPLVTLPTEYLRGRMGAVFLRTMNISELVAKNVDDYVNISLRLLSDVSFYRDVQTRILRQVDLIWEDMQYAFAFTSFLCTLTAGAPALTWNSFIQQTGRDLAVETTRRNERERNQRAFAQVWGPESWLLGSDGVARLETHLNENQVPKIFNNWIASATVDPPSPSPLTNKTYSVDGTQSRPNRRRDVSVAAKIDADSKRAEESKSTSRSPSASPSSSPSKVSELQRLTLTGHMDDAYRLAMSLLADSEEEEEGVSSTDNDHSSERALLLLEVGALQYFRSEYASAFSYCSAAAAIDTYSQVAQACVGVSGLYLDKPQETIAALRLALHLGRPLPDRPLSKVTSKIIGVTAAALEFNLITSLHTFGRHEECVADAIDIIAESFASSIVDSSGGLSSSSSSSVATTTTTTRTRTMSVWGDDEGWAHVSYFSTVQWSQSKHQALSEMEALLRTAGHIQQSTSLLSMILHVQQHHSNLVSTVVACTAASLPQTTKQRVLSHLLSLLSPANATSDSRSITNMEKTDDIRNYFQNRMQMMNTAESSENDSHERNSYMSTGFVLVTQHFLTNSSTLASSSSASASASSVPSDLMIALQRNLDNPLICSIHLYNQGHIIDYSSLRHSWKIRQHLVSSRLSFSSAISESNTHLIGHLVILGQHLSVP